uniref:Uncharacterized protein n=1 Tax=Arundo donax TaxID=35708 RepID=A0A0A9CGY9_ARUDO
MVPIDLVYYLLQLI